MRRMVVAILLVSSSRAEVYPVAPEVIANVSMLLAKFYQVDCLQIFRTDDLPLAKLEGIHRMWKNLAVVESKVTTGVYTYSRYLKKKTNRPKKVSCYTSLKIMSDDEESKSGYTKFSMKFSIKDAIWVLYADSLASVKFFEDARVVFDDVIIIAEAKSEDLILLHEVYRVSNGFPLKVLSLGEWTRAGGLQISHRVMYDRRSDLEGVALRTASVESWPASYLRDGKWQGFLIDVWQEIQSLINCTSVEIEAGDFVGMKMENESWNGLVGMATRNEIDVIVTEVVIDKERSRVLDFFHPIMKSSFQIYTRHLGYQWQWASILKPFHVSVWGAAVSWVLVATLFWALIHRLCLCHGLGSMDFESLPRLNSFFFVMQAMSQQGYHYSPNSYACRVFFFVSYAVSSVLIPSYSASLVSSLGQKVYLKSFDSLQEMVADGSYRLMVQENTAQHSFFVHSKIEFFKLAYEKLVKPVPEGLTKLDVKDSMRALCHLDNYAVMDVEDIIESRLRHLITLDCPVVHLTNPVSTVYVTMAAAKDNPYWGLINHQLAKLLNNGVVERLRRAKFPPHDHAASFLKDPVVDVGMRQLVSAFLFIACFAAISVLLLLLEIQWLCYKSLKTEPKRKRRGLRFHDPGKRFRLEMKMQRYAHGRAQTLHGFFPRY